MIAYRLVFDGPLRVAGDGSAWPRSDTLHAALVGAVARLGEEASRWASNPPFAVSSCFPWATGERGEPLYLLPRPLGSRLSHAASPERRAAAHLVRWLSPALLSWALGAGDEAEPAIHPSEQGEIWSDVRLPERLWRISERFARPVERVSGAAFATPRRLRTLTFEPGAGLYFLASLRDKATRARFEAALRLLGDDGFGRGAPFRFEIDENFRVPTPGKGGWLLLSLYHPTAHEVDKGVLRGARYALVERRGVHTSGAPRRALRMIAEGARLADVGGAPMGTAVRVLARGEAPGLDHDVWRSGVALCVPAPRGAA